MNDVQTGGLMSKLSALDAIERITFGFYCHPASEESVHSAHKVTVSLVMGRLKDGKLVDLQTIKSIEGFGTIEFCDDDRAIKQRIFEDWYQAQKPMLLGGKTTKHPRSICCIAVHGYVDVQSNVASMLIILGVNPNDCALYSSLLQALVSSHMV